MSAFLAAAFTISYRFTDRAATALGQITGEGATVATALDQNAAGHGRYIDATRPDTTDDHLAIRKLAKGRVYHLARQANISKIQTSALALCSNTNRFLGM